MTPWGLVLHGGAGVHEGRDYRRAEDALAGWLRLGQSWLEAGRSAIDVVEDVVAQMEDSGLFVAGRGSAPGPTGIVELDATIMDGRSGEAGGVAALQGIASAVRSARLVMDQSDHCLLAGDGATAFARDKGVEMIGDLTLWLTIPVGFDPEDQVNGHGTVGAVALDPSGALAAATATGGTYGALPGRVGDTAVVGAGTWADRRLAVSCTGQGEAFIRSAAAHDLAARVQYARRPLTEAAEDVLRSVARCGGDGGLIAITAEGEIVMPFNSKGMKRAAVGSRTVACVGSIGAALRAI